MHPIRWWKTCFADKMHAKSNYENKKKSDQKILCVWRFNFGDLFYFIHLSMQMPSGGHLMASVLSDIISFNYKLAPFLNHISNATIIRIDIDGWKLFRKWILFIVCLCITMHYNWIRTNGRRAYVEKFTLSHISDVLYNHLIMLGDQHVVRNIHLHSTFFIGNELKTFPRKDNQVCVSFTYSNER